MKPAVIFSFVIMVSGLVLTVSSCGGLSIDGPTGMAAEPTPNRPLRADLPADPNAQADATDKFISAERARLVPEFVQGEWINSDALTLAGLKGKVVYIEFWTFSCYNCINTLPTVNGFDASYREKGLTVIGIQAPEFEREKVIANIVSAVKKEGIKYPILVDNDMKNWDKYGVNAWPTIFILDKAGRIRYKHLGEGAYDTQEK